MTSKALARMVLSMLFALAGWTQDAFAQARESVLVLGAAEVAPRAGFVEALEIQLAHRARVTTGPALGGGPLAQQIEEAGRARAAAVATLAVWTDLVLDPDGQGVVLLHLVGDREGRTLVLVHRVAAREGDASIDRALAVKVADVLDSLSRQGSGIAMPDEEPAAKEAQETALQFVGDLGPWAATGSGSAGLQGGVVVGLGLRLEVGALTAEVAAVGRYASPLGATEPDGRIETQEGAVGGELRAFGSLGVVSLGGQAAAGGRIVAATGATPVGASGTETVVVPFIALLPAVSFDVGRYLDVRLAAGVEIALARHRFGVNDQPLLDLGTARGVAAITVAVSGP